MRKQRGTAERAEPKRCAYCGQIITEKKHWQYCNNACRDADIKQWEYDRVDRFDMLKRQKAKPYEDPMYDFALPFPDVERNLEWLRERFGKSTPSKNPQFRKRKSDI